MAKKNKQLRGAAFMNALDARIQALTPEDMLDTSEEDARTQENFKMADALHQKAVERTETRTQSSWSACASRLQQEVADKNRQTSEDEAD